MLKCLMLMSLRTVAHRYHHSIDSLNRRSKESTPLYGQHIREVEMGSLPLLHMFLHLVVWVMLAQCFTKDLPSLVRDFV